MICILLIIIAGMANAVMDTIAHKGGGILPNNSWWSMKESWRNKWKNGDPKQGEAFLGSSTVFVLLTDAWHFFQSIMLTCLIAPIAIVSQINVPNVFNNTLITSMLIFVIGKASFSVAFELTWRFLNRKK